jgi:hypothetical protein
LYVVCEVLPVKYQEYSIAYSFRCSKAHDKTKLKRARV